MLCSFREKEQKFIQNKIFKRSVYIFFLLISHRILGIILSSLLTSSLWSRVGGLARIRGLPYGTNENHSNPECRAHCWASHPVSLLESCFLWSGTPLCLFASLQFVILPSSSLWPLWCFPTSLLKAAGQNGKVSNCCTWKEGRDTRWGFLLSAPLQGCEHTAWANSGTNPHRWHVQTS